MSTSEDQVAQSSSGNVRREQSKEDNENRDGAEEDEDVGDEGSFEVERILGEKFKKGKKLYRIRWKGYGSEEDSWEPVENLEGAQEVLEQYIREKAVSGSAKKKRTSSGSRKSKKSANGSGRPTAKRAAVDQPSSSTQREEEEEEEEHENSDFSMSSATDDDDEAFAPEKKKAKVTFNASASKPKKPTHVKALSGGIVPAKPEKPTNLSANPRWIDDSSDMSSDDSDDVKAAAVGQNSSTTAASSLLSVGTFVVNSSTESPSKPPRNNNNNNLGGIGSPDKLKSPTSKEKEEKKLKTSRKSDPLASNSNAGSSVHSSVPSRTVNFLGVFRRDTDNTIQFVGINEKTGAQCVYSMEQAYVADAWSMVRYLSSIMRFEDGGRPFINIPNNDNRQS